MPDRRIFPQEIPEQRARRLVLPTPRPLGYFSVMKSNDRNDYLYNCNKRLRVKPLVNITSAVLPYIVLIALQAVLIIYWKFLSSDLILDYMYFLCR